LPLSLLPSTHAEHAFMGSFVATQPAYDLLGQPPGPAGGGRTGAGVSGSRGGDAGDGGSYCAANRA
jgi:hypothetical protein